MKRWRKPAGALFLFVYFLYFYRNGLRVPFAPDTFMNMDHYWLDKPLWLLVSQFQLWRRFYRPMGGLFYMVAAVKAKGGFPIRNQDGKETAVTKPATRPRRT